jgi:transmembrane sensor
LPFDLNIDSDFAKVQSRLNLSKKPNAKVLQIKPPRTWLRVAAAVAFLLVTGFILQNMLNEKVAWKNMTASADIQELKLPDGSIIWLNVGSTLSYPETFSDTERTVKLTGGSVF